MSTPLTHVQARSTLRQLPALVSSTADATAAQALSAQASIGGQAVMEGVMMRSPHHWAVALRRYNGEIAQVHRTINPFAKRHRWARLPVMRGIVALGESLGIGFRALSVSAHYAAEQFAVEEAEREAVKTGKPVERPDTELEEGANPDHLSGWAIAFAFVAAIGFSILLFKVAPLAVTKVVIGGEASGLFVLFEGLVRVTFFCLYLVIIGFLPDLKRLFQYHSAEHKAINAWEQELPLDPVTVNEQSRIHVRCGTAFLLWVMVVAIFVFAAYGEFRGNQGIFELVASRILFVPLIAGMSFELIKFAGRHPRNVALRSILAPGLWLQRLTTRECGPEHCEVAIASLERVLNEEYPGRNVEPADEDEALEEQVLA